MNRNNITGGNPRFRQYAGLVLFALLPLVGCSDGGPELARVKGKVTVDGVPIQAATLTFAAESGSTAYGITDKNGEYELMYTDTKYGAQLGKHNVTIEATKISKGELAELEAQGITAQVSNVDIPKQYKKPGALTAEVTKGKNVVDFALESKNGDSKTR